MEASVPLLTVWSLVQVACERLRDAGVGASQLDAELITGHVFGLDRAGLRARGGVVPTPDQVAAWDGLVARAEQHEPVQYLLGRAPFRTIDLAVDNRVLIPRPETELLVELVLDDLVRAAGRPYRVVDACTGSGAVAIAIAVEAPRGSVLVDATDISADALEVARANVRRHDCDVSLHEGSLLEPVAGRRFDAVVANPPYVPRVDEQSLASNVRDHEPHLALFVDGDDPLELADGIARQACDLLEASGLLAIEVGLGQHEELEGRLRELGYEHVTTHRDLQGIGRVVVGRRRG